MHVNERRRTHTCVCVCVTFQPNARVRFADRRGGGDRRDDVHCRLSVFVCVCLYVCIRAAHRLRMFANLNDFLTFRRRVGGASVAHDIGKPGLRTG